MAAEEAAVMAVVDESLQVVDYGVKECPNCPCFFALAFSSFFGRTM